MTSPSSGQLVWTCVANIVSKVFNRRHIEAHPAQVFNKATGICLMHFGAF